MKKKHTFTFTFVDRSDIFCSMKTVEIKAGSLLEADDIFTRIYGNIGYIY